MIAMQEVTLPDWLPEAGVIAAILWAYVRLSDRLSRVEGTIRGWLNPLPPSDRKEGS